MPEVYLTLSDGILRSGERYPWYRPLSSLRTPVQWDAVSYSQSQIFDWCQELVSSNEYSDWLSNRKYCCELDFRWPLVIIEMLLQSPGNRGFEGRKSSLGSTAFLYTSAKIQLRNLASKFEFLFSYFIWNIEFLNLTSKYRGNQRC